MQKTRDDFIDALRGIAILDMILVHYASSFPHVVTKLIVYHDVAIEGFLLLSGFVVGMHYLPLFISNRAITSLKIFQRVIKIILIQYVMILTASLPEFLIQTEGVNGSMIITFLLQSFFFYNQIGLMHILPIFIPLFILTPLLLYLMSKELDYLLLLGSVVFFILGQIDPYLINYGDKSIFPVVLWQIYFVCGCCLGKIALKRKTCMPRNPLALLVVSSFLIIITMAFRHTNTVCPWLTTFMYRYSIVIQRFPLNGYGLIWGASLWLFIYSLSAQLWKTVRNLWIIGWIALFGRHSLLAFVVHVYFSKSLSMLQIAYNINQIEIYFIILINIVATFYLLKKYEKASSDNQRGWLFRVISWIL